MMANMAEFPCVSYGIFADWDTSLCWVETYLWDPKIVLYNRGPDFGQEVQHLVVIFVYYTENKLKEH